MFMLETLLIHPLEAKVPAVGTLTPDFMAALCSGCDSPSHPRAQLIRNTPVWALKLLPGTRGWSQRARD